MEFLSLISNIWTMTRILLFMPAIYPSENSTRGRDAQSFYSHLLTQIHINNDCDSIFVAADFNFRIGSISDFMSDIDEISNRISVDKTVNQHGHEFIDFLNEAKFCVLNYSFL